MDPSSSGILFASAITVGIGVFLFVARRFFREEKDQAKLQESIAQELHIPPTLHPVIDPNLCIGSLSCVKVCPEGDILGVVDGKAILTVAANCIGHARCELECPVDAIKLVFGTSERGVDLPELDKNFETNRAGVHIVGEMGGMRLIKNAISQGFQLGTHLSKSLGRSGSDETDVAIVGAGPAGMSIALTLQEAGTSFRIFDQAADIGGTIATYPRHKIVMTETVKLPFVGRFGKSTISKEDLLAMWQTAIQKAGVRIETKTKIEGLEGKDGRFQLQTSRGPVSARKVVLAIGRMGTPRKLGAPGEDLQKVTYRLIDPEQYRGKQVLVVGGGDSALESAIMLAEKQGTKVAISYRRPMFGRCRPANKDKIYALIEAKKVLALMNSKVASIQPSVVVLDVAGTPMEIPNDYVLVNAGGVLPTDFLKQLGIEIKRHFGSAPEKKAKPGFSGLEETSRATKEVLVEETRRRKFAWWLVGVGALILAYLWFVGWNYYYLTPTEKVRSPLHAALKPGGPWGHGVGIAATLVMLSNFLYAIRKNWRVLKGRKAIRSWLTFHMFFGFFSPLVILFHAAFQSNNIVATLTYVSLILVVGTGIVGRFIYGLVPVSGGRHLRLAEIRSRIEQIKSLFNPTLEKLGDPKAIHALFAFATRPYPAHWSMILFLASVPLDIVRLRFGLWHSRRLFRKRRQYNHFRLLVRRLARLKRQTGFYGQMKRLLSWWRAIHVVLAIFLLIVIAIHIWSTVYLGYTWTF